VDVLSSHLAFTFRARTRPCMCMASVNPTSYSSAVQRDELVGLETESGLVCGYGRLAGLVHG
jgi:hypothetical protein